MFIGWLLGFVSNKRVPFFGFREHPVQSPGAQALPRADSHALLGWGFSAMANQAGCARPTVARRFINAFFWFENKAEPHRGIEFVRIWGVSFHAMDGSAADSMKPRSESF